MTVYFGVMFVGAFQLASWLFALIDRIERT